MSLGKIFETSSQGMTAQRERLETATANLANANTTRTVEGGPYRRRDVIFEATPGADTFSSFDSQLRFVSDSVPLFDEEPLPQGVRTTTFIGEATDGVRHYNPGHPDANSEGYVNMPDIDPLEEMVNILSAARSFEANATAFNTAKEMMRASLRLSEA